MMAARNVEDESTSKEDILAFLMLCSFIFVTMYGFYMGNIFRLFGMVCQ